MDIKIKRLILITLTCVFTSALISIGFSPVNHQQTQVVATVNGAPASIGELQHWMLLNKAKIYNHYYQKYEVAPTKNFWSSTFNGQTPLAKLKDVSLNDVVRSKVKQQLAKNLGVEVTDNYQNLMEEREKINEIRKRKVANGEVIYGPITFSQRTYFSRVQDKITKKSQTILSATRFKIPDNKMKHRYNEYEREKNLLAAEQRQETNITSFSAFKAVTQNQHTEEEYDKLVGKLCLNATIEINNRIYEEINLN